MSTLRVDSITNSGAAVNFPSNVKVGDGYVAREYYSQATAPTTATPGALWWDSSTSTTKIYLSGEWYTVDAA